MHLGRPDRAPYFEEGIRKNVIHAWRRQGLQHESDLKEMFALDYREEVRLDIEPYPSPVLRSGAFSGLSSFLKRFAPTTRRRRPFGPSSRIRNWQSRDHVLMFRVHRGLFQTMGVRDWRRFHGLMELIIDSPGSIRNSMERYGLRVAGVLEKVLERVVPDAIIISEPIGGNTGPLISPNMYEELVLSTYGPFLETARRKGVDIIILRTYANARALIPRLLKWGINCLWASECAQREMDYRDLRREFGTDLRLIGGIDLDVLLEGREAIRREISEKIPPLLVEGGYAPLADGRVRENVPFENYVYYRKLLEEITEA
jgi:hypothetical protein